MNKDGIINIKSDLSVNNSLAETCPTHQALLTEQLVILQESVVATAVIDNTLADAVSAILVKAQALTKALKHENQPLALLTHLIAGAGALDFSG